MARALVDMPGVHVSIAQPGGSMAAVPVPVLYRWYQALDSRLFGMFDDPLEPMPLPLDWPRWTASDRDEPAFDLVVLLGSAQDARADCLGWGRHGALWYEPVDAQGHPQQPLGFHEVMARQRSSAMAVRHQRPGWSHERTVYWSQSSTDAISMRRNREQILWQAQAFIPRLIAQVLDRECQAETIEFPVAFQPLPATVTTTTPLRLQTAIGPSAANTAVARESISVLGYPTNLQLLGQVAAKLPDIIRFYEQAKLTQEQWFLKFELADEISLELDRFESIVPPRDRIWADPHVFFRDGIWHVFIEEMLFAENKGFISVLQIDEQGRWNQPVKVLERDYHLSYPQVFEHRGAIYMLPESSANRTIELYRCVEFPHRWTLEQVLRGDIEAVDSSLLYRDGRWWLFSSVKQHPAASENNELHIFSSDELLGGHWQPHPGNPVISDVTRARPAGRIIEHRGQLLRPSQNCAGIYGYGLNLNEIVRLDETGYEERLVSKTTADCHVGMIATHTLARDGRLTVVDACQRIRRLPF